MPVKKKETTDLKIFKENLNYINEFNARNDKTYTLKMNQFGDLTHEEFIQQHVKSHRQTTKVREIPELEDKALPPVSFDWRQKGVVGPVLNQGQCGDVVAIVAVELAESVCAINTSKYVQLSLQQLIDCSEGCNGGTFQNIFRYIEKHGLESGAEYPYTGMSGNCKYNASKVVCKLSAFVQVPTGNETAMEVDLVTYGPLAAGIDASHNSFQFYSGGVYYEPACSSTQLDTAIFVVGYGVLNNADYWICENSWGTGWGMNGYILMSRNRNNNCGIATDAYYGIDG